MCATGGLPVGEPLGNQRLQRVRCLRGVKIEYQPVLVSRNRLQGKYLRLHEPLEIDHQPHHARRILSHANTGNVGVVGLHLGHQLAQRRYQVDTLDINGQTGRFGNEQLLRPDFSVRLDGQAGVVGRWPDAYRYDTGTARYVLRAEQQHHGTQLKGAAAAEWGLVFVVHRVQASHAAPAAVWAVSDTERDSSGCTCRAITKSASGK